MNRTELYTKRLRNFFHGYYGDAPDSDPIGEIRMRKSYNDGEEAKRQGMTPAEALAYFDQCQEQQYGKYWNAA